MIHSFESSALRVSHRFLPILALLLATGMWGSSFALQKDMFERINPVDFLGIRFFLAGLICVMLFWKQLRAVSARTWKQGALLGAVYAVAQQLQAYGLSFSSAAVTGFLTGMYVVITPMLVFVIYKMRQPMKLWFAVALAAIGLAVMSLNGFGFGFGEALVLVSAVVYALHVVFIERFVHGADPLALTAIQMIALGIICMVCALPGGVDLPAGAHATADWISIIYQVLFSGIGSLLLQTWAQGRMSATQAAVVMTSEPVWAALFAVLLISEHISVRTAVGGILIVTAMLLSQIEIPKRQKIPERSAAELGSLSADNTPHL